MSDKFTDIVTPNGGLGEWGYVAYAEAVEKLRSHYEREAKAAAAVLADIEAGRVRVYHQLGPWAMKNRKEVSR